MSCSQSRQWKICSPSWLRWSFHRYIHMSPYHILYFIYMQLICQYTSIKKTPKFIRCFWKELNFQLTTRQSLPQLPAFGPSPKPVRVSSGFCQNILLLLVLSFALIQIWPHFASLFKLVDFYLGELSLWTKFIPMLSRYNSFFWIMCLLHCSSNESHSP